MKLIIDIDEKYYNDICNSETASKYSVLYALNGIRNGIPLEEISNPCIECSQNCCVCELNGEKCESQKVYIVKENKQ